MKTIKYFFEFIFIYSLLIIFKIIGYKNASNFGAIIGKKIGPLFRSNTKKEDDMGVDELQWKEIINEDLKINYG